MNRAGCAAAIALAMLAGCAHKTTPPVFQDNSPQRSSEAYRLALEAEKAMIAGRTDEAITLYQRSIEQSPDLFGVWNNLGTLLMAKGNYIDAAEAFKSAADLAPGDPRPFYNVGVIYWKRGYPSQALDYFVKSLERNPRYRDSLRGAVAAGKLSGAADQAALDRVRTAKLLETDTKWGQIEFSEEYRIEEAIKNRPRETPTANPPITLPPMRRPRMQQQPAPGQPTQPGQLTPELEPQPMPIGPAGPTGATGGTGDAGGGPGGG
jgi:tetratricopeptide (TPR) repeat protein